MWGEGNFCSQKFPSPTPPSFKKLSSPKEYAGRTLPETNLHGR
ncbi:hypothetical protein DWUX_2684 [Desulfovibrio diazotrophicus]|nr:hypothetical protein DWUX_2684 [Desulfovibrio diazotrophicus]